MSDGHILWLGILVRIALMLWTSAKIGKAYTQIVRGDAQAVDMQHIAFMVFITLSMIIT